MNSDRLSGLQRAAVLLMCLGEETAARVFDELSDDDINRLTGSMATINHIPLSLQNTVLQQYMDDQVKSAGLYFKGNEFARKSIHSTSSKERTESLLNQQTAEIKSRPFSLLPSIKPKLVADIIHEEHPQTIALILSTQSSDYASEVISCLPEESQADIVYRIAKLEYVSVEILDTLEKYLEEEIGKMVHDTQKEIAGFDRAVELLSRMKHNLNTSIIGQLEDTDSDLAQRIKKKMFTFEALAELDDRILQSILRRINNESLALALKTSSDELKQRFFSNMSSRAAEMIRDDLETLGPIRLTEVEAMQQSIVKIAMKLQEESLTSNNGQENVIS
ncbi:MAG: flagellar motor switch protein FliG [Desulfocapsaceae bacterium]